MSDFEQRLKDALELPVDPAVVDRLLPGDDRPASRPEWRGWALAASLVTVVCAGFLAWQLSKPVPAVEDYVRDHYRHDGGRVLARAGNDAVSPAEIASVLGAFQLGAGPELAGQVTFIKFCPTPHGRGAHMVLKTPEGPVTVIVMPDTTIDGPARLAFDDVAVQLLEVVTGSAAIIGPTQQADSRVARLLQAGLVPSGTGA